MPITTYGRNFQEYLRSRKTTAILAPMVFKPVLPYYCLERRDSLAIDPPPNQRRVAMLSTLPAQAQTEVDLALVITTRISYALDIVEQRSQRRGIARAFHATLGNDAI